MSGNWKANVGAATLEQIPVTERQADLKYTVAVQRRWFFFGVPNSPVHR